MRWLAGLALAFAAAQTAAAADLFLADSKRMGDGKMDIVIAETERGARTSLLDIRIGKVGSSVGSSFFIACSLRDLARVRGGFRHVAKLEFGGARPQMLVGFLERADEAPTALDLRLAGQAVIDLEQFAPICDLPSK
jgi:hypothetical protein